MNILNLKKLNPPKNDFGLDFVRVFAMFSVISLHFFLHSNFYKIAPEGANAIILGSIRNLFYQCVPLFLLLTGFLKRKAKFEIKHYIKIVPIIVNSLLIGVLVIAYKILVLKQKYAVLLWLKSLWTFLQPDYGWYINMYISLFLVMPILNLAYNSLKTETQKQWAVLIMIFVTTFSRSVNRVVIPHEIVTKIDFVPSYCSGVWFFAYYFVGMYIGEYRPKINKIIGTLSLIFMLVIQSILNLLSAKNTFYTGTTFENGDFVTLITATILFLLIYDIKTENIPIRCIFAKISQLSMTFYLTSYVGDTYFYKKYAEEFTGYASYPKMFFKIIPLHFILCILISFVINWIVKLISKPIMKSLNKWADKLINQKDDNIVSKEDATNENSKIEVSVITSDNKITAKNKDELLIH